MHSAHRDLESKYRRVLVDLANANKKTSMLDTKLHERNGEITHLKTLKAEHESTIT
jgi:hypothetical protein